MSGLAAVSIEVWLNTYVQGGVSQLFVDYVLSEFTSQKFRNAIEDNSRAIWVSATLVDLSAFEQGL